MEDIIGKKFNKLVIEFIYKRKKEDGYNLYIRCRCECGNKKKMRFDNVKRGQSKSCGCQEGNKNSDRQKRIRQNWMNQEKPSKKYLENLYVNRNMSLRDISSFLNISNPTILRWLREYEIPRRPSTNSKKMTEETKYLKMIR